MKARDLKPIIYTKLNLKRNVITSDKNFSLDDNQGFVYIFRRLWMNGFINIVQETEKPCVA